MRGIDKLILFFYFFLGKKKHFCLLNFFCSSLITNRKVCVRVLKQNIFKKKQTIFSNFCFFFKSIVGYLGFAVYLASFFYFCVSWWLCSWNKFAENWLFWSTRNCNHFNVPLLYIVQLLNLHRMWLKFVKFINRNLRLLGRETIDLDVRRIYRI